VRIFAATNRNLDELVQARKFRLDLYYRLNVATIDMPPLRERREDIAALIQYYLKLNSDKYGCAPKNISDKAMQFLREHPWPGNIRELKNLIEKLVILSKGDLIDLDDLPSEIFSRKAQAVAGYAPEIPVRADEDNGGRATADLSLRSMEVEYIRKALRLSEGNQRKAAKLLNISRDTLRYRLKKLGIDSSHYVSDC
jgi:transcriptional regulator with PAS, ATPase and Fis domain